MAKNRLVFGFIYRLVLFNDYIITVPGNDKAMFFPDNWSNTVYSITLSRVNTNPSTVERLTMRDEHPERIAFDPDIAGGSGSFPVMFGAVARRNDGVAPCSGLGEAVIEHVQRRIRHRVLVCSY